MIDANNEHAFLWLNLRAYLGFRARVAKSWIRYGHVVRDRAIRRYLASHPHRRLHLGSSYEIKGFLNSQILGPVPIDITRTLPFPDASLDLIYSSHLVEHVHRQQMHCFLREAYRVLRPGGMHLIATPSLRKIVETSYGNDETARTKLFERGAQFHRDSAHTACHQINLTMRAFGHRFLVDYDYMAWIGKELGYSAVSLVANDDLPDPGLSDYIRSRKPARWHAETETFCLRK